MSKKILIVEDEIHVLDGMEAFLRKNGFEVVSTRNVTDALALAWEEDPDVIIIDLSMPMGKASIEFIREVRVSDKKIPIIALASGQSVLDKTELEELGVNEQISRPFLPKGLLQAVQKALAA